jgi:hypothetical protein
MGTRNRGKREASHDRVARFAILVAVFAAADSATLHGPDLLAYRVSAALTTGTIMLTIAMLMSLAVRPRA